MIPVLGNRPLLPTLCSGNGVSYLPIGRNAMSMVRAAIAGVVLAMLAAGGAVAQSSDAAPADTTSAAAAPAATAEDVVLSPEELEQLVAPIALYPDQLLADVLIAATYPLEVIEADRWAKKNKSLKGEKLAAALDKQGWDQSVKSLVGTPSVLAMMSEQLEWTRKLGDTMLAQQANLMDAVQRLRLKAQEAGQLKTTKEQIVTVEEAAGDHQRACFERLGRWQRTRSGSGAGDHDRARRAGDHLRPLL